MLNLRTDIAVDKNKDYKVIKRNKDIEVLENKKNNIIFHTIKFNNIENNSILTKTLKRELMFYINSLNIKINHILFVGLGNESNTADSIGPKTIKKIKVNYNIYNKLNKIKISALIPGVLGVTGIRTNNIINSVIKSTKPNLIVLIDSLVTNNIDFINKTIELSNKSISPGSGIYGNNEFIKTKIPIISIGIPTSLEYVHNEFPFLLTPVNIDNYVFNISNIISNSINELVYKELMVTPL